MFARFAIHRLSLLLNYRVNLYELLTHIEVEVDGVERHCPQILACWGKLAVCLHVLQRIAIELEHFGALGACVLRRVVYLHRLIEDT